MLCAIAKKRRRTRLLNLRRDRAKAGAPMKAGEPMRNKLRPLNRLPRRRRTNDVAVAALTLLRAHANPPHFNLMSRRNPIAVAAGPTRNSRHARGAPREISPKIVIGAATTTVVDVTTTAADVTTTEAAISVTMIVDAIFVATATVAADPSISAGGNMRQFADLPIPIPAVGVIGTGDAASSCPASFSRRHSTSTMIC